MDGNKKTLKYGELRYRRRRGYSLTELGKSLRIILNSMEEWGTAYKEGLRKETC